MERRAAADVPADCKTDVAGAFKEAMRRLAATVTIISAVSEQRPMGIAATAVISLSMDPPALLASINRQNRIHGVLTPAAPFCVNILGSAHAELCKAFGGGMPQEERFRLGEWRHDEVPYLTDAEANVFCRVARTVDYGTHTLVIGHVEDVRIDGRSLPLIYGHGRFLELAPLMV